MTVGLCGGTRLQVSDQLVEINGDSTAGMTHSQAVEQIRRGGRRIHLVLKRGNGYVPDYGEEVALRPRVGSKTRLLSPLLGLWAGFSLTFLVFCGFDLSRL